MIFLFKILYIISYFNIIISKINGKNVYNKDEFIESLVNGEETLSIGNHIVLDNLDVLNINIKKISISGSANNSTLNFVNVDSINLSFLENCEDIKLKNIAINGNIKFNNNLNIDFYKVKLNGYFISNNNDTSIYKNLKISYSEFHLPNQSNGYEIYNYHMDIINSKWYGNTISNIHLIKIENAKTHPTNINIKNSNFDGNYYNGAISLQYASFTCSDSKFEQFYSGYKLLSGGALNILYSNNTLINNKFNNNYSVSPGGSISIKFSYQTYIDYIVFRNSTSYEAGHAFSFFNNDSIIHSYVYLNNVYQYGNLKRNHFITEGTFFSSFGSVEVSLNKYYGSDINTGSLITIEGDGKVDLVNMSVDRFYSRDEGALIKSYNPRTRGARIFINTFNIKNIVQESEQYTASIISSNSGSAIINGLYASNIQGIKSGLIFLEGIASVNMMNSTISNLKTVFAEPILNIRTNGTTAATTSLKLKNFILRDVYENGVLIFTNAGGIEIVDSEFHNIHECNKYNKCNPIDPELKMYSFLFENAIIYGSENVYLSSFNFTNNIFSDIYGMVGMEIPAGDVAMINNTITNSYFKNGFLYYTNYKFLHGTHNYSRLKFINNRSEKGTFINFNDVYGKGVTPTITCIQCSFVNNTAEKFGGIIYANARDEQYIDTIINFKNCEFIDNNAMLGKISYVFDVQHAALFQMDYSVLNKLKKDKNNFVTNPTHLSFDNYNKYDTIEMLSGDIIEKEYSCTAYDDYGNKFEVNGDINSAKLDELLYYDISLKDNNDSYEPFKIYGPTKGYCMNNSCKFKNLRVVANPGNYLLEIKIVSFGQFFAFKDNLITMKIKIKECNESLYINQDRDGINIKSCYLPKCNPQCVNAGKCVNDNLCDCSKTSFTGKTCSEYYKQKRNKITDYLFLFLSYILIALTITVFVGIYFYRKNQIIKAASYDFLNFMLVGILLNALYIIFQIKEHFTKTDCYFYYIFDNLGFILIYGSIITKSLRIYLIFFKMRHKNSKTKAIIIKYIPLVILIVVHILVLFVLLLTNSIKSETKLDTANKEYEQCVHSRITILSEIFNVIYIIIGSYTAYAIRSLNERFKEPLFVPIYTYIIYIILYRIVTQFNNNKLIYIFQFGGTLTNSFVIIYFLYIDKIYRIYIHNYLVKNNLSVEDLNKNVFKTHNFLIKNRNSFLLKF